MIVDDDHRRRPSCPSRTRSSTPISTSVPTSITELLIRPTTLDDAASLQQDGVRRDAGDQLAGRARGDRRHGRAQEAPDHRRARVQHDPLGDRAQERPLPQDQTTEPTTTSPSSTPTGAEQRRASPSESSTHFVTIGVGEPGGVAEQRQDEAERQRARGAGGRRTRGAAAGEHPCSIVKQICSIFAIRVRAYGVAHERDRHACPHPARDPRRGGRRAGANATASLGDIATAAEVGRTTLHRYFTERSDLLSALTRHALEQVVAAGGARAAGRRPGAGGARPAVPRVLRARRPADADVHRPADRRASPTGTRRPTSTARCSG